MILPSAIDNYGVRLERLTEDKLELVRSWRNNPAVSRYMFSQDCITEDQQKKWFDKIDNENNLYFLIKYKHEYIGLVDMNDIDYDNKIGENGFYIANEEYRNVGIVAYQVLFCLFDYWFIEMGMDCIISRVLHSNNRAARLVSFIGSTPSNNRTEEYQEYRLYKDAYFSNINRKKLASKLSKF